MTGREVARQTNLGSVLESMQHASQSVPSAFTVRCLTARSTS